MPDHGAGSSTMNEWPFGTILRYPEEGIFPPNREQRQIRVMVIDGSSDGETDKFAGLVVHVADARTMQRRVGTVHDVTGYERADD